MFSFCPFLLSASRDHDLHVSERARHDLALSWSEMKSELSRLNKNFDRCNGELRQATHHNATITNENLHLKAELKSTHKSCDELNKELTRLRLDLSATREELHQGKKLHQLFTSDITMHRQIKENLGNEIRVMQGDAKKAAASQEELHQRWEKSEQEVTTLRQELSDQVAETQRAQREVERVSHELGLLRASREVMTRQWEGALTAMHKRDQTMHAVGAARSQAEGEVAALRNTEHNLAAEIATLRKSHQATTDEHVELKQKYQDLLHAHSDLQQSHSDLSRQCDLSLAEKSSLDTSHAALLRRANLLQSDNDRLKLKVTHSSDAESFTARQLEEQIDLNKKINQSIATVENTALARTEAENNALRQKVTQLEHEKQVEVNKAVELAEQLKELARKNQMLNAEFVTTSSNYATVIKELKSFQINLDHMTYRANKAESESLQLRTTKEEERLAEQMRLQGNIHNLEKELNRKSDEVAKMNQAYVIAEEKVLEAHKTHNEISSKTNRLKSELRKAEGVQDRLKTTIESLGEEKVTILKENNEHRLQVKKNQELIARLVDENTQLKSDVHDARFACLASKEQHELALSTAKAEVVRLRSTRAGVVDTLESSERESGLWQRKYTHEVLQHTALKAEFEKLTKLHFAQQKELKGQQRDATIQEKQYATWMKNFENMFEKQNKKIRHGAAAAPGKLTFSANHTLTAKQVLDNFNSTAASLPPNSATLSTSAKAGHAIMAAANATGGTTGAAATANPAMDSLNSMLDQLHRSGVAMVPAHGSSSARALSDSDSRSSLLSRACAPGGGSTRSSSFTESLVGELRGALHKSSTAAAERQNEIVRIKADLKLALQEANEAASREGALIQRCHLLSTQAQSLNTNLTLTNHAYARAESIAASLERQLRTAQQELMSVSGDRSNGDHTRPTPPIRSIDYQYYPDLEPSPLLRSILSSTPHSSPSPSSSPSAAFLQSSSNASLDEEKSVSRHGRTARIGLGRSLKVGSGTHGDGGSSGASLPYSSIASTVSLHSPPSSVTSSAHLHNSSSAAIRHATQQFASSASLPSPSPSTSAADLTMMGNNSNSNQQSFANLNITLHTNGKS